ncbi:MAG: hypothetical protein WDO13_15155 [Verrucomicrobiota bacterium]
MNGEPTYSNWTSVLRRRAELLHQQIAAMQRLVRESGGSDDTLGRACAPYYRLLDEIYDHDMPVARALDRSDLLLHLDGEGLQTGRPRLSLVTGIMGDVRKQVGTMIKTLVSSINEAVELPREIDLGLSSFAQGSLYLGFTLPEPGPGYLVLEGDPLFAASRQALATLGAVTEHINEPNAYELIAREFADPKLRDAALSAVGQLAPQRPPRRLHRGDRRPRDAHRRLAAAHAGDAPAGARVARAARRQPADRGVARAACAPSTSTCAASTCAASTKTCPTYAASTRPRSTRGPRAGSTRHRHRPRPGGNLPGRRAAAAGAERRGRDRARRFGGVKLSDGL